MMWKCPDCKAIRTFNQKCNCGFVLSQFDDIESLIVTFASEEPSKKSQQPSAKIGSEEPMNVEKDVQAANDEKGDHW